MTIVKGTTYKTHLPCPDCASSDAASLYKKEDDSGNEYIDGFCWSCEKYITPKKVKEFYGEDFELVEEETKLDDSTESYIERIKEYPCRGWKTRKLKKDVNEKYGVRTEFDLETGGIKARFYPITENEGNIVGFKRRLLPKSFSAIGKCKNSCEMFGQSIFPKGGKFLVITGGEEDALAMAQVFMDKVPQYNTAVISPITGEPSLAKQIKANFDYVSSFETVVIMMDSDEPGKKAADDAAKLLKPGQAKIAKLRLKDPCKYLEEGCVDELYAAFWRAEKYSPAGIVGSSQTFDSLIERASWVKLGLPEFAHKVEDMLNGGPALGEIVNIAAPSSVGKTTVTNEFLYHTIMNSPYKVGAIPLESDLGELMENLLSVHMNIKLPNMQDEEKKQLYKTDKFKKAYEAVTKDDDGNDRFFILDHQGDVVDEDLKAKIEYLVKVCGCKVIILDPLTLALSGKMNEGMDEFMSWLLRFVKREKVVHINVVHVRKNGSGSKANSTGADIHEEDMKGSGSIFQVGMINILLMRDKENESELVRNTTKVVISKSRRTGKTGPAGFWYYNSETSRLEEGFDPHGDYASEQELMEEAGAFDNTDPESLEY